MNSSLLAVGPQAVFVGMASGRTGSTNGRRATVHRRRRAPLQELPRRFRCSGRKAALRSGSACHRQNQDQVAAG
jgi:hypothetical protein